MKNNNFYCVFGWMMNELGLRNKELIAYAVIYSFSQDERTRYAGGLSYLCACTGTANKASMHRVLQSLVEKGLIIKIEKEINGIKLCDYAHNPEAIKSFAKSNVAPEQGGCCEDNGVVIEQQWRYQNDNGGVIKMITHNKNIDNIIPPKDKSLDPHGVKTPTPTLTGKISPPSSAKESFGEFGTVKLTRQEYEKVCALYQRRANEAITILDDYLASHGKKKYTSHYAVLKRNGWVWEKLAADGIPFGPRILDPKDFKKAEPL